MTDQDPSQHARQPTPLPGPGFGAAAGERTPPAGSLHEEDLLLLAVGSRWGDFEILDVIGEGGMGRVFRAHQLSLGREVALKVLIGEASIRQRRQFITEAKALASVDSPHVVTVHLISEHCGHPYFVMEYVRGQNLAERLDGGWRPSHDQAIELVLELAHGVAAVTAKRLCHRDIKPANIMITPSGMLKLMDFGLVGRLGGSETTISTANEAVIGTASYLSPEQGYGMTGDHRSDIYSMGVVFYELLTGRLPFAGANSLSLIYHHIHTVPPLPRSLDASIPAHLERVIMRCLCKNPAHRYQSVEELIGALESSRFGIPRLLRRHGLPLAGLAILLLALAWAWAWHAQRKHADGQLPSLGTATSLPGPSGASGATSTPAPRVVPPAAHPLSIAAARPAQSWAKPPPAPGLGEMAMDADGWHAELRLGALDQSFRWCPPGSCTIGSPGGSRDHQDDEQLHRVTISRGFWLAATPTSQAWWSALMGSDPSTVHAPQLPVDHVSRDDCQRFCQLLQHRVPGLLARLPWEAEWEYACRGGRSGGAVSARELYRAVAWINADAPRPVGSGTALVWGLQDLLGNTGTWCADTYGPYGEADTTDPHPQGPGDGVARGGSWESTAPDCNSAHRFRRWSDLAARGVGLRLVVEAGGITAH